jgi:ACS family allantoate permease-like MFS transporter
MNVSGRHVVFLIVMSYCIPNGGLGNFLHLILQSYGFSSFETILVGLPQAAVQVFFALLGSWMARRFKGWRIWIMVSPSTF